MEQRLTELMELVKNQNNLILEMQQKITILEDRVLRLSVCKLSNGSYPYYDFILSYGITPEQQTRINRLFMAVAQRQNGGPVPLGIKEESYSTDFLYQEKPIQLADVTKAIASIWPVADDELPLALIKAIKEQGMQIEVCDYLLSQA